MSGVALTIESDDLDKIVALSRDLQEELTSSDLLLIAGRAIRGVTKEHFEMLSRDSTHHQIAQSLGAAPTGFYEEASRAVQEPVVEGTDIVSISINGPEGLAQRYFGGTIEARPGSYLTIPARAEAYGHRAGEFANLKLIIFGDTGLAALVEKDAPQDEGSVFYWLVRSVTQASDPTVLPTEEELTDAAIIAMRDEVASVMERKAA